MGEVECSVRLYGMLAGLRVCYLCWRVSADGMKQSLFRASWSSSQWVKKQHLPVAKWFWQRALTAEVLVQFPSGAEYWQQSRLPFLRSMIVSQEGKLINFDIVNPLSKSNRGRGRMSNFVFWRVGSVLFVSGWVTMAWSKVLFRASWNSK